MHAVFARQSAARLGSVALPLANVPTYTRSHFEVHWLPRHAQDASPAHSGSLRWRWAQGTLQVPLSQTHWGRAAHASAVAVAAQGKGQAAAAATVEPPRATTTTRAESMLDESRLGM